MEKNEIVKRYKLNGVYYKSFYDEELQLVYIFYNNKLEILKLDDMKCIFKTKIVGTSNIVYSNKVNKEHTCANFILLPNPNEVKYYSLYYIEGYKLKNNKKLISESKIRFVPSISNIENLKWEANYKEETSFKKYLNIDEIKNELELDYNKILTEKKDEVQNYIESKESSFLDYIQLLKMIIKDNTNKQLIMKYLKYIQKEENNLKLIYNDNYENFQNEYNNYKILFDNKDLNENEFQEITVSQKDIFINMIIKIAKLKINDNMISNNKNGINKNNSKEINDLLDEINEKIKHLQLFNQPINISNNELYWYRNCFILFFALKKIITDNNKLKLMKETIKIILNNKIFDKKYILNDHVLLTTIIILIAVPQPKNYLQYNLNLIETKDPDYNYENEINNNNLIKFENQYYLTHNNKRYFLNEPSKKCIKNFILNIQEIKMNLEEFEENNYNELLNCYNEIIDFNNMKIYLSKIFNSNVFKEAFKFLYPEYYKFPFKDEKDTLNFLNKYYRFIPFNNLIAAGITEKFSLEIYYCLKKRAISPYQNMSNQMNKSIQKILYRGAVVKTSCHEINHDFYNILLMKTNGKVPLETPRKKYFDEKEREGGRNMEIILFNCKICKLSLIQCLYLLNEKNWNKNLQDFRRGFNELSKEDLIIDEDSIFKEFNEIINLENFDKIGKAIIISCDDNDESNNLADIFIEDIEDVNDILGFIRE